MTTIFLSIIRGKLKITMLSKIIFHKKSVASVFPLVISDGHQNFCKFIEKYFMNIDS